MLTVVTIWSDDFDRRGSAFSTRANKSQPFGAAISIAVVPACWTQKPQRSSRPLREAIHMVLLTYGLLVFWLGAALNGSFGLLVLWSSGQGLRLHWSYGQGLLICIPGAAISIAVAVSS